MKLKNAPARKLARQLGAKRGCPSWALPEEDAPALEHARTIRTKKQRASIRF